MDSNLTCDTCGNTYSSPSSLLHHKRTARFCLTLQNVHNTKLACDDCKKEFTTRHNYTNHLSTCRDRLLNRILQLESQVKYLEDQNNQLSLENTQLKEYKDECIRYREHILEKDKHANTTIINNNTTNNTTNNTYNTQFNQLLAGIVPFTPENINEKFSTIDHEKLLSFYIPCEELLRNQVVDKLKYLAFCVDQSRRIMVTKNEAGDGVKQRASDVIEKCMQVATPIIVDKIKQAHDLMNDMYNNDLIPDENIDFINDNVKTTQNMFESTTDTDSKRFNKVTINKCITEGPSLYRQPRNKM